MQHSPTTTYVNVRRLGCSLAFTQDYVSLVLGLVLGLSGKTGSPATQNPATWCDQGFTTAAERARNVFGFEAGGERIWEIYNRFRAGCVSATSTHFKWELMLYCLHCPTLNKVFLLLLLMWHLLTFVSQSRHGGKWLSYANSRLWGCCEPVVIWSYRDFKNRVAPPLIFIACSRFTHSILVLKKMPPKNPSMISLPFSIQAYSELNLMKYTIGPQ